MFLCMAEREGFEPPELSLNGFQDRRLKPLGHLSGLSLRSSLEPPALNGSWRYFLCPTHVFTKRFGNEHAPVRLLEIFENGNNCPADGKA